MDGSTPLGDADFTRPWLLKDRVASGKPIDAITLGPKGYVAITHAPTLDTKVMPNRNNIVALSSDGVSWAERAIEPDGHYRSIAYGAGRYVAAGGEAGGGGPGLIIASVDGWSWTLVHEAGAPLRRIRHTEAGFIAVGMYGVVLTSRDGTAWIESQEPARHQLEDATFGAGRFVALGLTVSVGSPDGLTWSTLPCGPQLPCATVTNLAAGGGFTHLSSVEFGNGVFVAQGWSLLRSSDGLTWARSGGASGLSGFAAGHFIALSPLEPTAANGTSFRVSLSVDGQSWIERTTANAVPTADTCATPNARCLLLPEGLLLIPPAR